MDSLYRQAMLGMQRRRFNRHLVDALPGLYRLAMALSRHTQDAEDLVNDTCAKAIASYRNAELPNAKAKTAWLRVILINLYKDRYRRETHSPVCTGVVEHNGNNVIEFAQSVEPTPEDWAVYSDLVNTTQEAMATLAPEVRTVIALYMVDGRSYKDIAEIVDCPIGTVMSRLARGRRQLRESLKQENGKDADRSTPTSPEVDRSNTLIGGKQYEF